MSDTLRVLIIDDEPPARHALERMLRVLPDIQVVGSVGNGLEALDMLATTGAEVLLLDIEMPILAGMELAARLCPRVSPAVIFVTAWPQYAARAFEVQAADYLLKPVEPRRLAQAITHARRQLRTRDDRQRMDSLEAALRALRTQAASPVSRHVWVEVGRGRLRLALDDIEWFAADGDYVQAHTAERGYLMRDTLNRLQTWLPASRFVRVHRSRIVNLDAVMRVSTATNGHLILTTRSGGIVRVGRRARTHVRGMLGS